MTRLCIELSYMEQHLEVLVLGVGYTMVEEEVDDLALLVEEWRILQREDYRVQGYSYKVGALRRRVHRLWYAARERVYREVVEYRRSTRGGYR